MVATGLCLGAPLCRTTRATTAEMRWMVLQHRTWLLLEWRLPASTYGNERHPTEGTCHSCPMEERAVVGLEYNMPDTFASFYSSSATRKAGAVAALDEERKMDKHSPLNPIHAFTPVVIKTARVFEPHTSSGSHQPSASPANCSLPVCLCLKPQVLYLWWIHRQPITPTLSSVHHTDKPQ